MSDNTETDTPESVRTWPRKLGFGLGGTLAVLVVLYFIVTSGAFIKSVVLPRVGRSMHAQITAADVSLSPFSQIILRQLQITTTGTEPLLRAEEVRARYQLMSILRGNIVVDEIMIQSPELRIVQGPDGSDNLQPLLSGGASTPASENKTTPQVAIQNVALKNARITLRQQDKSGFTSVSEIGNLDITLDRLQNGQPGKLTLVSLFKATQTVPPGVAGTNSLLEGKLDGAFSFTMDAKLLPQDAKGSAHLAVTRAEGAHSAAAGLSAVLETELTPTELRQLALRFERGGQALGQARVSGPFDLQKAEARLKIDVTSIDRTVLNILGASQGLDFASSTFNATGMVDLSKEWNLIAATGKITGRQLSVRQANGATPALDVELDYQTQINLADKFAILHKFTVVGKQSDRELLTASLDRPMNITWATEARGFAESTFQISLTNLVLDNWRALLPTNAPSGRVSAVAKIIARRDAKELSAALTASVADLTASLGTNILQWSSVTLSANAVLDDFRTASVSSYQLQMHQQGQPLLTATGAGRYDLRSGEMSANVEAQSALPLALKQFSVPGLTTASGAVKLAGAYTQKGGRHSVTSTVTLDRFTGRYGEFSFANYNAALECSGDLQQDVFRLNRGTVKLHQGFNDGGSLDFKGLINLTNLQAEISYQIANLNQHALGPFLTPFLGARKLNSLTASGNGTCRYDPGTQSGLKGDLRVENWVTQGALEARPGAPLALRLEIDGSLRQQLLELRQCVLTLTPTPLAKNQLQLLGRLDLNPTNASPSQLDLTADALDLTSYYDVLSGGTNTATASAPSTQAATEPEAIQLPIARLTVNARIARLFLREVAVSNFTTTVNIAQNKVTLEPFQLSLNGAPVSAKATLDLGVPGYVYDMTFQADKVPVEPLVNSFTANTPGQFKGRLLASAKVRGAGLTGVNLRKNLDGLLNLSVTNMDLQILSYQPKGPFDPKQLIEPIATLLSLRELLQSPLTGLEVRTTMGGGQMRLDQFTALSPAFFAEARGSIPIADVLTNSPLNLPVNLSLRRALAEKANLVPANAPTNTAYVALPNFVNVRGTLGSPRTDTDKLVIAGLVARSATRFAPGVGAAVGNALENIGGLLTGQGAPKSNAPTNTPVVNSTPGTVARDLIQGIGGLFAPRRPPGAATNAAPTNTPPR